jgi:hypothetical protein
MLSMKKDLTLINKKLFDLFIYLFNYLKNLYTEEILCIKYLKNLI